MITGGMISVFVLKQELTFYIAAVQQKLIQSSTWRMKTGTSGKMEIARITDENSHFTI